MRVCPRCGAIPHFHYSSNVTAKQNREIENRNKWTRYFMWSGGCAHANEFGKLLGVIPDTDVKDIEARWDEHTEKLFAEYTATWTEIQKTAYRARIWPKPPAPVELFDRNRNEEPTIE